MEKMPVVFFNISRFSPASLSFASKSFKIFYSDICFKVPFPGKMPEPNFS